MAESPWRRSRTASSPASGIRRTDRCPSARTRGARACWWKPAWNRGRRTPSCPVWSSWEHGWTAATPPLHAHRHRPGARRPRAHAAGAEAVLASHAGPAQAGDRSSWLPDTLDVTVGYGLDGLELEAFGRHVTGSGDAGYRFGFGGTLEY